MRPLGCIELVPAGALPGGERFFGWLAGALERRFGVPVVPGAPLRLRPEWASPDGRYCSNPIVDTLIERYPHADDVPERWVLAVTAADLFAPGRDFVFGEAAQGGGWAVIGLARLGPPPESPDPRALFRRRVLKEAVHELGHLADLVHCDRPECVMYPSADLADTDRKSTSFCPACDARLSVYFRS